jgi:hypothetical protein
MRSVGGRLAVLLLAVTGAAGCGSPEPLPILDDPHEVVTAAGQSTAALGAVHARIELTITEIGAGGGPAQALLETDIDVQRRNVVGRSQYNAVGRAESSEFVLLDGVIFSRRLPAAGWDTNPDPANGDHLPTNAGYLALLEGEIAAGRVGLQLGEPEPCAEATCYRVLVRLDSEAAWRLLLAPITGDRPDTPLADRTVRRVDEATMELFVDQATRRLVRLTTTFGADQVSIGATVTFSAHDAPVQIIAPPVNPLQPDNQGGATFTP